MDKNAPDFSYAGHFRSERNVASHKHPGLEIILSVSGTCIQQIGKEDFSSGPGTLLVVPPETPHIQTNHGMVETIYAVFYVDEAFFSGQARRIEIGSDIFIPRWMQDLASLQLPADQEQGNSIMTAILFRLKKLEQQSNSAGQRHPALDTAVKLLQNHFFEPLTVDTMAAKCGISPSYLNALFNREFGFGPLKYLQHIRMTHARQLLRNPYLTVAEISRMCGYDHPYYFCRIFKKNHQCTPGAYRQCEALTDGIYQ